MIKTLVGFISKMFIKFKNLNIRHQLIYSYTPIFLVSLLIFSIISYNIISNTLDKNSRAFVSETIKLVKSDITNKLDEYEKISSSLVLDYDLYYLLSDERSSLEYYSKYEVIRQKLDYITRNISDIRSIFIYPTNSSIIIKSNGNINFNDLNYKDTQLFKNIIYDNKRKFWSIDALGSFARSNRSYIFLHRSIPTISGSNGVIQMQIYEDSICNIYKDISFLKGSEVFITDKSGIIVSHPDKSKIGNTIETSLEKGMNGNLGSFTAQIQGKDFLVVYSTIDLASWKLIATIPMDFIAAGNRRMLGISLVILLLAFVFSVFVAVVISSGIAKPLERVGMSMKCIEKGDFSIRLSYDSKNEIGNICKRFNRMADEIKILMETIRREEREKKEAYIQVLQAQIKPHFLYNTLFTIKCLASIKKQAEIEELLDSLINLLMGSINKGGEFIKVSKEIEYIKSYVLIQGYKYKDKFKIVYDIDPEAEDLIILKLLLQPIVENSILHGIESFSNNFIVEISGRVEGDDLVFRIKDNGKGMDVNKLETVLQGTKEEYKSVFSGIGIRNVNERLKLYFGDKYGLQYTSKIEEGTEAIIRLPVIKDEEGISKYA